MTAPIADLRVTRSLRIGHGAKVQAAGHACQVGAAAFFAALDIRH